MRADGPESLAEAITHGRGSCPLPLTHDRLEESHYWWHQMAKNYHEPPYFRWSLGAFIQASRNLTWMLQAEKHAFADFVWYEQWREQARKSAVLVWLNETRVMLTKQSALAPRSWARFRCLFEQIDPDYEPDEEEDLYMVLNPFRCTHSYIREGFVEEHGHEYQCSWEVDDMPGRELLDLCSEVYAELSALVALAHTQLGAAMGAAVDVEGEWTGFLERDDHRLPCMDETESHRTIQTYIRDGEEVWDDAPEHV